MTWHSEWMPRLQKFSKKSCQALSSWNRTCEEVGSEEVDAPEWRESISTNTLYEGVDYWYYALINKSLLEMFSLLFCLLA